MQLFNPSLGVSPATVVLGARQVEIHCFLPAVKDYAERMPIIEILLFTHIKQ
jgi:hypothetical protein